MNKILALRDERNTTAAGLRNLLDTHPGKLWNALTQREFDEGTNVLARLDTAIAFEESEVERSADARFDDAVSTIYRERRGPVERQFDTFLRRGFEGFDDAELRKIRATLSTTTPSQGGYTVSTNVYRELAVLQKRYSAVRDSAQVVEVSTGGPLTWAASDSNESGELLAENITATGADPAFSGADLKSYRFSSKIIVIPFELLQDSAIDLGREILNRLAIRLGRAQNPYFTTGNGTAQPFGFATQATVGKTGTAGQTTSVIFVDLVDLIGSVDPAYRKSPACCFMMNDTTLRAVRKLADTTNARPIFLPDAIGPERLLGFPISVNNDMASMGVSARSIAFGSFFDGFKIVDVIGGITMYKLEDSAYSQKGQAAFLAFQRSGGNLVDTTAVKVYVNSAT